MAVWEPVTEAESPAGGGGGGGGGGGSGGGGGGGGPGGGGGGVTDPGGPKGEVNSMAMVVDEVVQAP